MEAEGLGFVIDTEGGTSFEAPQYRRIHDGSSGEGKDELEEKLEEILFGKQTLPSVGKCRTGLWGYSDDKEESDDEEDILDDGREETTVTDLSTVKVAGGKRPVWRDEDDEALSVDISAHARTKKLRQEEGETVISGTSYSKKLRLQYEKLVGRPEWASHKIKSERQLGTDSDSESSDGDEGEDGGILQRTGDLIKLHRSDRLPRGTLDLKQMKDANRAKRAEAVVQALEFHPTASVVLVGGYHKTLDLFQVDGQKNPKLQSLHIQNFPISMAHFSQDGTEVVVAGRKKRFFVYDMMAGSIRPVYGIRGHEKCYFDRFVVSPDNQYLVFLGKNGYLILVSNKTKQWIADLKMNGDVFGVAFTADSRFMLSIGSSGKVFVWDMSTRLCVHSFADEGCIVGTRLAVSPDSNYVACGSESGVVNVYDSASCIPGLSKDHASLSSHPIPLKALMNLTTGVDSLCINSTGEFMLVASRRKKGALKAVHLPSQTVFSNWPTKKASLGFVTSLAMSPHSKYIAIGSACGRVFLYRLNHYSQQPVDSS